MTLSALIKKGGLAKAVTATLATTTTQGTDEPTTVAPVATVTVAKGTELTVKNAPLGTEPASELLPNEASIILAWLAHTDETDPTIIAEVFDKCRNDLDARRYFLKRADELPQTVTTNEWITCGNCIHFDRIDHPHLGHCAKSEPEAVAGLWDSDPRYCEQFARIPRQVINDCSSPIRAEAKVKSP